MFRHQIKDLQRKNPSFLWCGLEVPKIRLVYGSDNIIQFNSIQCWHSCRSLVSCQIRNPLYILPGRWVFGIKRGIKKYVLVILGHHQVSESQLSYHFQPSWFIPVDNFGTVVGENPTPYGILALWAVNGLSIVYWDGFLTARQLTFDLWPWPLILLLKPICLN